MYLLDVGFLRQLLDVAIEKLSVSAERKLKTIIDMLEENLLKDVGGTVPDPEKRNEFLLELMKKKSVAGAGMFKYSQNVLNCVPVYRVVKPKSDLVMVKTRRKYFYLRKKNENIVLFSVYKPKLNVLRMN